LSRTNEEKLVTSSKPSSESSVWIKLGLTTNVKKTRELTRDRRTCLLSEKTKILSRDCKKNSGKIPLPRYYIKKKFNRNPDRERSRKLPLVQYEGPFGQIFTRPSIPPIPYTRIRPPSDSLSHMHTTRVTNA
jgi:hypothetical protein